MHGRRFSVIASAVLALLMFLSACASATGSDGSEDGAAIEVALAETDLVPPGNGFQIETEGAVVEAGDDVEWCEVDRDHPVHRGTTAVVLCEVRVERAGHDLKKGKDLDLGPALSFFGPDQPAQ